MKCKQLMKVAVVALFAALSVFAATKARAAESGSACLVACAQPGDCELRQDSKVQALSHVVYTKLAACEAWKVGGQGKVLLRYRHQRKWFQPPALAPDTSLAQVFAQFEPDSPCGLPDKECLQARMTEKSVARAGHGVDSQAAVPAGINAPCAMGLPCGTVLPPLPAWAFKLADGSFVGQWRLRVARGAPPAGVPAQFEVPVVAGSISLAAGKLSPGGVYAYQLIDSRGQETASGEFAVMSQADLDRLRRLAQRRVESGGMGEQAAWIDALLASELDWDAEQLLQSRVTR
jgi:hypothetical protein